MRMSNSFFTTQDNKWFQPTPHTRGPWDIDSCHAGPPTGLIARALEHLIPGQKLCRLTVDLIRPIPFSGFSIDCIVVRQGRSVTTTSAQLIDRSGKVRVTAAGLHLTTQPESELPTQHIDCGSPKDASAGRFPITGTLHGAAAFNGDGVEVRYPAGESPEPGPTTAWMRTVPLLSNETASPFQRICPLADCGNAFGRNADPADVTFINPDLTLILHRDPVGEWLGTKSTGYWEPNGLGMADALLFDQHGVVGRAVQTLLLRKR